MNRPKAPNRLGRTILIVVCIHVIVALVALSFEIIRSSQLSNSFYKKYVLLGPYFGEETLKTSYQVSLTPFQPGKSAAEINYTQALLDDYCIHPWRCNSLYLQNYLRTSAWRYANSKSDGTETTSNADAVRLSTFVKEELYNDVDSISIKFIRRDYNPETKEHKESSIFDDIFD